VINENKNLLDEALRACMRNPKERIAIVSYPINKLMMH